MATHGMSTAQNTVLVDGMMVNGLQGDGAIQSYFNDAMNEEVSYQTSGIGADTQAGGVRLNMIPREGGNQFRGDFKSAYRPGEWQGSNLTQRHLDRGLTAGNATDRIIDFTFSQGGPVTKDKLWFFVSSRLFTVHSPIANTSNVPPGQTYAGCLSGVISCEQEVNKETINSALVRYHHEQCRGFRVRQLSGSTQTCRGRRPM